MRLKFTILAILWALCIQAQNCPPPEAIMPLRGNNISTVTSNGGDLFWEGTNESEFIVPADDPDPKRTIFAAGLWLGGLDPAWNLKIAAQSYGRSSNRTDFAAGPIEWQGTTVENYCEVFDKIWVVQKADVEAHLADYADNGVIDNPRINIFSWPGKDNAFFGDYHLQPWPAGTHPDTYAPFYDTNADGIYQPDQGEYPFHPGVEDGLFPNQLTWTVFNDFTIHTSTDNTDPILAEIQLCSWNFACTDNEVLNNTVFTSHTIRNAGIETIDSFAVGLWVDFDLGCYTDDYMGSAPELNTFYAYNQDNLDGETSALDCGGGVTTYGENPPVQSITFLNKSLDVFTIARNRFLNPPPGTADPVTAVEYYNYMTGSWLDGTPMTYGGDGYNLNSTDIVKHLYSESPTVPDSWSMLRTSASREDRRCLGTHNAGRLIPGQSVTLDMGFTYTRRPGADFIENVDAMFEDVNELQGIYDNRFAGVCGDAVLSNSSVIPTSAYQLSPNPTQGMVELQLGELHLDQLQLFDLSGRLMMTENNLRGQRQLDLSAFQPGMYLLHLQSGEQIATEKIVVID
ncbi:MAG: T9SS type A sorting domain-containing protein [Bacteroidota bacterium]